MVERTTCLIISFMKAQAKIPAPAPMKAEAVDHCIVLSPFYKGKALPSFYLSPYGIRRRRIRIEIRAH